MAKKMKLLKNFSEGFLIPLLLVVLAIIFEHYLNEWSGIDPILKIVLIPPVFISCFLFNFFWCWILKLKSLWLGRILGFLSGLVLFLLPHISAKNIGGRELEFFLILGGLMAFVVICFYRTRA
jgi:hypothetical protein